MCWHEVYGFLKDWQTLIRALIALIAALWTIHVMRRHEKEEQRRHEMQTRRKEMAARAQMPDALSDLSAYVRSVGEYFHAQSEETPETPETPEAPTSAMFMLKQVIEHIDDKAARRTFELVSWYQVQSARMLAAHSQPRGYGHAEMIYDVVFLCAYVNSLFDYARNEKKTGPNEILTIEDMKSVVSNTLPLGFIGRRGPIYTELNQMIERRHLIT